MEDVPLARKERKLYERWIKGLAPLLALLFLRNGEMTGYDLIKFIYQHFGVLLSPGTMYPILHSLQRNGVVTERVQGIKKAYAIAGNGKRALRDVRFPFVRGQSVLMSLLNYEDESASDANLLEKRTLVSEFPAIDQTAIQTADEAFTPSLEDAHQSKLTQFSLVPEVRHIAVRAEEILDYARNLTAHDHAVSFYSNPKDKRQVLFAYLKAGLDQGEATAYIAGEETPDEIRQAMRRFGIDVDELERCGALLVIDYKDWYTVGGKFNATQTIERWRRLYDEAIAKGFKGLRVVGETACFFGERLVRELVEYEQALHTVLEVPMSAICAYNAAAVTGVSDDLFLELLKLHGHAIFPGMALEL